jgi:hypothetical protein
MKIENNILISVSENDVVDGVLDLTGIQHIGDEVLNGDRNSWVKLIKAVIAPDVITVGNYSICFMDGLTTLDLSNLQTNGSYSIRSMDRLTTLDLSNLQTNGSYSIRSMDRLTTLDLSNLQTNGSDSICFMDGLTTLDCGGQEFTVFSADGDVVIVKKHHIKRNINLYGGFIIGSMQNGEFMKTPMIIAAKDGFTAHGKTYKQAIKDLLYKIRNETIKHKKISLESYMTDKLFHVITGACMTGIRLWKERHGITKKRIKVKNLLPIFDKLGGYEVEKFKSLIIELEAAN